MADTYEVRDFVTRISVDDDITLTLQESGDFTVCSTNDAALHTLLEEAITTGCLEIGSPVLAEISDGDDNLYGIELI